MSLFGTDGIRNKVGHYPFTQEALPCLGKALALWAQEKYGEKTTFLIASDTRYSCSWIKASLTSGILHYPVTIHDAEILPTPGIFHLMKDNPQFTCGIIISASHNPAEDNGIKLVDSLSGKLTKEDEQRILTFFDAVSEESVKSTTRESLEDAPTIVVPMTVVPMTVESTTVVQELIGVKARYEMLGTTLAYPQAREFYIKKIVSLFDARFLEGYRVVLDCAHGATFEVAAHIFSALGADCIAINTSPNGYNINDACGATDLASLKQAVLTHNALMGFAFDGDGDRVVAINARGEVKDGDDILAILLGHPDYKELSAVVSTVMSNQGFEAHVESLGKKLIRTPVGDKHVAESLHTNKLALGGETSGHIILNDIISTGDGILVALKLLETAVITKNFELRTFTKYPQILINVPIKTKKDLTIPPLSDYIAASRQQLLAGRLLVRYSGTESIVRVMVEDADSELTKTIAHTLANQLHTVLS